MLQWVDEPVFSFKPRNGQFRLELKQFPPVLINWLKLLAQLEPQAW